VEAERYRCQGCGREVAPRAGGEVDSEHVAGGPPWVEGRTYYYCGPVVEVEEGEDE
jgi:hypothetical protein